MKYVVKMVGTCPEGAVENVEYWIAESEAEMQAMISLQRELSYIGITCLGPVVEPNGFLREKIANAQAHFSDALMWSLLAPNTGAERR